MASGSSGEFPLRRTIIGAESALALAGTAGAGQLIAGVFTPPVSDLPPGLTSWVAPGVWLFATVAVPSGTAAVLAYRRSHHAPTAVLASSALLGVELLVQIPFVGPSALQAVFGTVAVGLAGVGLYARRTGWRPLVMR
jgi:hypothetical protein